MRSELTAETVRERRTQTLMRVSSLGCRAVASFLDGAA